MYNIYHGKLSNIVTKSGMSNRSGNTNYITCNTGMSSSRPICRLTGESMSLCLAVFSSKELYLASDSRLSLVNKRDSNGNILCSTILKDNFQKIYIINDKTALCSTGQGEFGDNNESFTEILSKVDFNGMCLEDIAIKINDTFSPILDKGESMDIYIGSFETGVLRNAKISVGSTVEVSEYLRYPNTETILWYHLGINWTLKAIEDVHESNPLEFIKKAFKSAYCLKDKYDDTIGGPVKIIKLSPNGYEWVEENLIIE